MSEIQTITLEDIRANPALNKANVEPGDTYTIGEDGSAKITRVFSEEGGIELGTVITEQTLKNQPELAEMGVEVGDRYLEDQHKIIKTGSGSGWEQAKYGSYETPGLLRNTADIVESYFPIGTFNLFTNDAIIDYISPEESYGEGYTEADPKTRRAMIRRARERQILDKYGRLFTPDPESKARMAGQFGGAMADPTSLIPFLGPVKGAALGAKALRYGANVGIGGGLGAGYSVTEDLAAGEDVDVKKALQIGALSAAGTGALLGAGRGISKLRDRSATKQIDLANNIMARHVAAGGDKQTAVSTAQREIMSMGGMPIEKAIERTGRKIRIPTQKNAQKIVTELLADETVSRHSKSILKSPILKGFDNFLGSVSTRIGKISEPVLMRFRAFEFDSKHLTHKYRSEIEAFTNSVRKMKATPRMHLARHLMNGRFNEAKELMSPSMLEEFTKVEEVLKQLKKDMVEQGLLIAEEKTGNYFPRSIKEYDKLLQHWGEEVQTKITARLREEQVKQGFDSIDQIPKIRRDQLANQVVKGYGRKPGVKPKSTAEHARKIDEVTDDLLPFYDDIDKTLQMYVRNTVNSTERAKFFGKGKIIEAGQDQKSIGQLLNDESFVGRKLTPDEEEELISLIQSRFKGGEQTAQVGWAWLHDLGYTGTIANPISAITQLGDIGVSGALHGFKNTIGAMFRTKDVKLLDVGLDEIAQEMADIRWSAKALKKLFKWSGFKAVDRLGKETSMNAALRKNVKLLKTAKGEAAFRKKWGKFYGNHIDDVITDLRSESGKLGYWKKFHAFNELSDMQPITMLEMPKKYIDHPDGRILYALKTFTLKQYDVVRRNIVQEYNHGSKKTAIKNAGLLAGYLTAANVGTGAVKDILQGRDPGLDNIPDKSLWALLGVYGFNQYGIDKYLKQGKATDWAINTIAPALPYIDFVQGLGAESVKDDPNIGKHLRPVPLIGPLLYNWFGGGAEKYNERMEKARRER